LDGYGVSADAEGVEFSILGATKAIKISVRVLGFLVDAFVNTFGITPPTPATRARAGRVIATMLVAVATLVAAVAWGLRAAFLR
jgi:hypothetical protein